MPIINAADHDTGTPPTGHCRGQLLMTATPEMPQEAMSPTTNATEFFECDIESLPSNYTSEASTCVDDDNVDDLSRPESSTSAAYHSDYEAHLTSRHTASTSRLYEYTRPPSSTTATTLLAPSLHTHNHKRRILPRTLPFHYDLWLSDLALTSPSLAFRERCLLLIRLRAQNDIPREVCRVIQPVNRGPEDAKWVTIMEPPRRGVQMFGGFRQETEWDVLLDEMKRRRDGMREGRWGRMEVGAWLAGECRVWEEVLRVERGNFVVDERGMELVGERVLGYRREGPRKDVLEDIGYEMRAESLGCG